MQQGTSERFWAKVDKSGECWMWTAASLPKGYGRFGVNGSVVLAHRFSWQLANGPIPDGMHVDHLCHEPSCVRPSHLRLVTPKQNIENFGHLRKNNTTGAHGVSLSYGRFRVRVRHNRTEHLVGTFDTLEEASRAAQEARLALHTHNDRDRVDSI